jgi:DNA-binding response OmpR family regulator
MGRILIADDHDALRRGLARALTAANHEVEEAPNGNQAIERLHDGHFDVVLSDLKMGGSDGLDVLRTTKTLHPSTAVILMTAFGSVHTAVEAMKSGAFDYVQKPFEIEEMEVKIEKALEMRRMRHELDYLRHTQNDIYDFDRIVGQSESAQAGARRREEGGQEQHDRADSRRDGHRQGADRRRDPSQLAARVAEFRQGELRGASRDAARIGVVRTREGRVHGRRPAAHRSASNRPTAEASSSTKSAT